MIIRPSSGEYPEAKLLAAAYVVHLFSGQRAAAVSVPDIRALA